MSNLNHKQIAKLVKKVKEGDSNSFAKLYELTYQKVYFFSLYLTKNETLAQDVVQETFIYALKQINTLKDDKLFVAWLNRINYTTALKILEKEKNISLSEEDLYSIPDHNPNSNPMKKIVVDSEKEEILSAISTLPYGLRAVIIMKYYHDMKNKEIAMALDCPVGTVKSRLNTARNLLKHKLIHIKEEEAYD
ncbi:MAG: sigma-70 family RNA polymerase sigma factor [Erysipelotrichaceae bacterium]|nr:sigma-70 family RNA polymerase sigma factor [Erysipelotrichaceae bacterium]